MEASRFIGRVGGLAVALGIGAAALSGTAVAWADRSDAGSDSSASASSSQPSRQHAADRSRGFSSDAGPQRKTASSALESSAPEGISDPVLPSPPVAVAPHESAVVESVPVVDVAPAQLATPSAEAGAESFAATVNRGGAAPAAAVALPAQTAPAAMTIVAPTNPDVTVASEPAPAPAPAGTVSSFMTQAVNGLADGAGSYPGLPAGSPIEWGLLAFSRREPLTGLAGLQSVALQSSSSQLLTNKGISVNPVLELVDGVIQGNMQVTSSRDAKIKLKAVDTYAADGGKLDVATVPLVTDPTKTDPESFTVLPYGTWLDGKARGVQKFDVRVSEVTAFDTFITGLPLVGAAAGPIINLLQQLPLISDLLAPIIGASIVTTVSVDVGKLAPGDTPLAFTYRVKSFDGAEIRTNFFPASGIEEGDTAPTAMFGPGLGGAGATDPYGNTNSSDFVPTVAVLRDAGYNVVTWDPRGEYDSGGVLQLDNPFFEGRDASALVSWFAQNPLTAFDDPGDPKVGMVGGSYGGGVQWVTAGTDPRIDAVVPGISWYSLNQSLYPADTFKTAWGNFLVLALTVLPQVEGASASRVNNLIYQGVLTGNLFNWVSESVKAFAGSSGPTVLLNKLTSPALVVQGTVDSLFPLGQAVTNAETILANPFGTPVKMIWFCGGHGRCADPINPDQKGQIYRDTVAWLDQYVADKTDPTDVPTFQWYDQTGTYYSSDLLSFQDGFNAPDPYRTTGKGGTLPIIPVIGGSGSTGGDSIVPFPLNLLVGFESTEAKNALNLEVKPPVGTQIVGAPNLSFTYSGLGTSSAVFAQFVDNKTGRVVGSIVTPIQVKLDGKTHTVDVPLEDIAYTVYDPKDTLTLQIVASSTLYQNSSVGVINVSDVQLDLPVRA